MKAVVWDGELRFVEDRPVPVPARGEALIKVLLAGICNTDIEITKGYMGFAGIPGHEFVGTVLEASGPDRGLTGKRVVGDINCCCGECSFCRLGMRTHCPDRTTLGIAGRDGAFAEYLTLPVENLLEVPVTVSDQEAVFTEPLAAAFEIIEQVHVKPTDRVLVMGDGKLGLLAAFVLNLTKARITLTGRHEEKLAIARGRGIEALLPEALGRARIYDLVVEATGTAEGFESALSLVRPRGTIVLKSTVAEGSIINLSPLVVDEVRLVGSRCGPFGPALRALSGKAVDVGPLVAGVFPFSEAEEAFRKARERGSLKFMIEF